MTERDMVRQMECLRRGHQHVFCIGAAEMMRVNDENSVTDLDRSIQENIIKICRSFPSDKILNDE